MKSNPLKGLIGLAAVSAISMALTIPALAWSSGNVTLSVTKDSTGATATSTVLGQYDDSSILYVSTDLFFGDTGLVKAAGTPFVIRNGSVFFTLGQTTNSIAISTIDGKTYIPALETLNKLALKGGLVNNNIVSVTAW